MRTRVVLADDHKIMREGLRSLLERDPDIEVVGEAENGRAAVELARQFRPDVVLMDVTMPDLNGIEATHKIKAEASGVKIVGLSMHADKRFVAGMLRAGASGYLLKDCAFEELVRAIQSVTKNQVYLGPAVAALVTENYVRGSPSRDGSALSVLTAKEREVLQLLAEGKGVRQIAGDLHVSVKTVQTHRQRIMERLNIHSMAELVKYAVRERLTSLEN